VPGGGISLEGDRWLSCRPGFFLPVRPLGRLFRGKFLAMLQRAYDRRLLGFHGQQQHLADPSAFAELMASCWQKEWVVYAKPPFGGPQQVLKYLARYTHRVAISNHRLVKLAGGRVTFRYRDYADARQEKLLTLSAEELLRRFVMHVLPKGFMKIRHYGLLASRQREARLRQARRLLLPNLGLQASARNGIEPVEPVRCPACGSVRLARGESLPRTGASPFVGPPPRDSTPAAVIDTS
jgi:hypothetical protein